MTNPSTVWTQLSIPNPPAGSIPFVTTDGATIVTDVLNFMYSQGLSTLVDNTGQKPYQLTVYGGLRVAYDNKVLLAPAPPTINKPSGRVRIKAGDLSILVTCSYCTVTSMVIVTQWGVDNTDAFAKTLVVFPGAGYFILSLPAVAAHDVDFDFLVVNRY